MSRSTLELLREALVHLELTNKYASDEDLDQLVIDDHLVEVVGRNRSVGPA